MQEMRRTTVRQLAGAKWVAPFHRVHKDEVGFINNALPDWDSYYALARPQLPLSIASQQLTSPPAPSRPIHLQPRPLVKLHCAPAHLGDRVGLAMVHTCVRNRQQTAPRLLHPRRELHLAPLQLANLTTRQDPPSHFVVPCNWSFIMQPDDSAFDEPFLS